VLFVRQSGQENVAAAGNDDPASRHPSRLNSVAVTGGHGLQSTPGVSRLTPGDSTAAPAHDYAGRTHGADGPTDMHVNSRLAAEHTAANCTSLLLQQTSCTITRCHIATEFFAVSKICQKILDIHIIHLK